MKKLILALSIFVMSCQQQNISIEIVRDQGRKTEYRNMLSDINYNSENGCKEYIIMFKDNIDSLKEKGFRLSSVIDSTNVYKVCWN